MKQKVTIIIDGGNVQAAYSNNPDIKVTLIDHDNLREEYNRDQRERIELKAINGLREVIIQ